MNEEIERQFIEILEKANEGIDTSVGFFQAQMPEVVRQLLLWEGIHSFVFFVLGLIIVIGVTAYSRKEGRKWADIAEAIRRNEIHHGNLGDVEACAFCFKLLIPAVSITAGTLFILANLDWFQILVAPKYYLAEFILNMA